MGFQNFIDFICNDHLDQVLSKHCWYKKICIQFYKTKIIMFSNLGKKQNQENIANVSHLSGCRNFSRGHMIMLYIFKMQYRSISFERTNSHDHTIRGTHCSSIRAKTRFPPGVAQKKTPPLKKHHFKSFRSSYQ